MSLKKPALDPLSLEARTTSGYPEPYRSRVLPREKRALGDALGLKTIGINQTQFIGALLVGRRSEQCRENTASGRVDHGSPPDAQPEGRRTLTRATPHF